MPDHAPTTSPAAKPLVLVSGSGRSGTSTVAGALSMLGLRVPQPEVPADESNPRGFFESEWVVDFHKRVLAECLVHTLDGRPDAAAVMAEHNTRPALRDELGTWLAGQPSTRLVVKDPRAVWFGQLWREASADQGFSVLPLTMLRHPAEVVGSRGMHYLKSADEQRRRERETGNLAGWVNVTLTQELATRGEPRAFCPYLELLGDWRSALRRIDEQLGLGLAVDEASAAAEIDEFIDPDLRRSQLTFDDVEAPARLKEIAASTWEAVSRLVVDPGDESAQQALDSARTAYSAMYDEARLLVQDHVTAASEAAKREIRKRQAARAAKTATPSPDLSLPRRMLARFRATPQGRS